MGGGATLGFRQCILQLVVLRSDGLGWDGLEWRAKSCMCVWFPSVMAETSR